MACIRIEDSFKVQGWRPLPRPGPAPSGVQCRGSGELRKLKSFKPRTGGGFTCPVFCMLVY